MMESTNQELSHDNNLIAVQHRQQQELIKLLTQHFHNQFYQLACTNRANQFCPGSSVPANMSVATSNINNQAYPATTRGHQSPRHSDMLLGPARGLDLSCMDLLASATGANKHLQLAHEQQALARSQQSGNNTIAAAANQLLDFSGSNLIDSYQFDQFNIMNALALNGANDETSRLALSSSRQQSIIQAIRQQHDHQQESLRGADRGDELRDPQQRRNHRHHNLKAAPSDGFIQDDNEQSSGGKSLLKFSINTILGRNSPQSNAQTDCETSIAHRHGGTSGGAFCNNQTAARTGSVRCSEEDDMDEERKGNTISESDAAIDSSSDTNSPQASTPLPQMDCHSSMLLSSLPPTGHQLRDGSNPFATNTSTNTTTTATATATAIDGATSNSLARAHQQSLRHMPQAHLGGPHSLAPFLANSATFPWTVTSRGKPRRGMMRRAVFSDGQRVGLEKRFQMQKYISKPDRKKLAEKLGLRDSQVKIWFQNRRMKWRNSKERELLSAGGSREQTLPTRNNPNPDLSDVGETIRRLTSSSNTPSATTAMIAPSNLTTNK